jgi:hypothetical protein
MYRPVNEGTSADPIGKRRRNLNFWRVGHEIHAERYTVGHVVRESHSGLNERLSEKTL